MEHICYWKTLTVEGGITKKILIIVLTKHRTSIILIIVIIIVIDLKRRIPLPTIKYSRQRESIKNYLTTTKTHPTADSVYLHTKEVFPNISLGTVYRNLNLLADMGEITKIATPDGGDRFDGRTEPHNHFFCTSCKRILDLDMDMRHMDQLNQLAQQNFNGAIHYSTTLFYGTCSKCKENSQ